MSCYNNSQQFTFGNLVQLQNWTVEEKLRVILVVEINDAFGFSNAAYI